MDMPDRAEGAANKAETLMSEFIGRGRRITIWKQGGWKNQEGQEFKVVLERKSDLRRDVSGP